MNEEAKHTTGPIVVTACLPEHYHVSPPSKSSNEMFANASLFAAAPDLLKVAEMVIKISEAEEFSVDDTMKMVFAAAAAIAEAKGK